MSHAHAATTILDPSRTTWAIVVAVGAMLLGLTTPGVAPAAGMIDQQQPVIDITEGGLAIGTGSRQKLAQVVTPGLSGALTQVRLPVACDAGELLVEIRTVLPDGSPDDAVLASQSFPAASLPSFFPDPPFLRPLAFQTPPVVVAGQPFVIALSSTGSCGVFQGPVGGSYDGGNAYFDARPNPPGWVCICDFAGEREDLPFQTVVEPGLPAALVTAAGPVVVRLGLANSDDVGIRFDILVEVSRNGEPFTRGQLEAVHGGSSGLNNAREHSIPLADHVAQAFTAGDVLSVTVYARNACEGSGTRSGRARLWYGDAVADSRLAVTIDGAALDLYLLDHAGLDVEVGSTRSKLDVSVRRACGPFQPLGSWSAVPADIR